MFTIALAALLAATTPTATTDPEMTARLKGSAQLDFWHTQNNTAGVKIDTGAVYAPDQRPYPTKVWGTAHVFHDFHQPGQPTFKSWADVRIDCLTSGGPTATVTGVVEKAAGGLAHLAENRTRIGLSFYVHGKKSRVGIIWGSKPGETPLPKCTAPAATFPVVKGGFVLKGMPY
ncbi:hypothetical protein [Spirillospora sp. CA-294931]|uniref:hypothetical protein n=1 Tax=Spirillospora sp. CA-294931 TaxID=3240042 RepID=UPI003D8ECDE6